MPTLDSGSRIATGYRPRSLRNITKGSKILAERKNVYVFNMYFHNNITNNTEIRTVETRDSVLLQKLIQFAFNCTACYPKLKEPEADYSSVENYDFFCGANGIIEWPTEGNIVLSYDGFYVSFFDGYGLEVSLVINYED